MDDRNLGRFAHVLVTIMIGLALLLMGLEHEDRLGDLEAANQRVPQFSQVLVGQGCDGPDPIAVAVEEDLLPRCDHIDVHQVALGE